MKRKARRLKPTLLKPEFEARVLLKYFMVNQIGRTSSAYADCDGFFRLAWASLSRVVPRTASESNGKLKFRFGHPLASGQV
jgi:hypothetical protein